MCGLPSGLTVAIRPRRWLSRYASSLSVKTLMVKVSFLLSDHVKDDPTPPMTGFAERLCLSRFLQWEDFAWLRQQHARLKKTCNGLERLSGNERRSALICHGAESTYPVSPRHVLSRRMTYRDEHAAWFDQWPGP